MTRKKSSEVLFLEQTDLLQDQVRRTIQSYRENASTYALDYERNQKINGTVVYKTALPFIDKLQENHVSGNVLFAGCGSGRDLQFCEKNDKFSYIGIDTSGELLDIAVKEGVKSQLLKVDIFDYDFDHNKCVGIFCDTALTHSTREMLDVAFQKFHRSLKPKGVLFVEFRLGDGRCYKTVDKFGERFYLTHSENEARGLLQKNGFKLNEVFIGEHPIKNRPGFIAIIATRI